MRASRGTSAVTWIAFNENTTFVSRPSSRSCRGAPTVVNKQTVKCGLPPLRTELASLS
jgi:hypothetical protein